MSEDNVRQALLAHWRETYPPDQTMLVPRFVVAAEVIDSDGDETLRVMTTKGTPSWVIAGLLHGAQHCVDTDLAAGWEPDDD